MELRYPPLLVLFMTAPLAQGQSYCSPTFANGCFNWNNQSILIGDIDWTPGGSACTVSDYTAQSTYIGAGVSAPMTVTNGVWCGCAVWVDLDQSLTFEESENLFHSYVGGAPSYTYNFSITVPPGTPTGDYRMRVIGAWGSDGFSSTNMNGFGPCGQFQYGNFQDFTLNVDGSTGIGSVVPLHNDGLRIGPNPVIDGMTLIAPTGVVVDQVDVMSMDGRMVHREPIGVSGGQVRLNVEHLPSGSYIVRGWSADRLITGRFIKE